MSWKKVKLGDFLKQYRIEHIVKDDNEYKQVTISKHDGVCFRGYKNGKEIGRKRQFIVDLKKYPNTLMFVRQGLEDGSIGIAPNEVDGCIVTENMPMFSIENINKDYLKYILKSSFFKNLVSKISTTGSAQKSIHERQLIEIEINIPSLENQAKIVKNLEVINENFNILSNELSDQLDLVKKLRQQILQDAVQGKLVEQNTDDEPASILLEKIKSEKEQLIKDKKIKKEKDLQPIKAEEIPFDIPDNWVWCRLGQISTIKIGSTPSRQEPKYWNGNINWVSSGEVANNNITKETKEKITQLALNETSVAIYPIGTVLVAMIGQGKTRGQTSILKVPATTNQNVAGLLIEHGLINSEFLWYFFLSRYEITRSHATGGNQPALNSIKISNILFSLPPLSEQKRIVAKVEELMKYCDELEQNIKSNQQYTQQLMQVALKEALTPPVTDQKEVLELSL